LGENFHSNLLQQALTHRSFIIQEEIKQREVGIENPVVNLSDNGTLIEKGEELISEYVIAFLKLSLKKLPKDGIKAIYKHLMSEEILADISSNLGTKDLILTADFPVESSTLASTLKAVVAALFESSGEQKAVEFVRDFVCTRLNQLDVFDLWDLEKPIELLQEICRDQKLGEPEPRLISETAKNTIFAAYQIGMYCNKKMLGRGFGETVDQGIEEAAKDCLRTLTETQSNMTPFNFKISAEEILKFLNKSPIAQVEKI
jgi:large subunit ribosomal protein L44